MNFPMNSILHNIFEQMMKHVFKDSTAQNDQGIGFKDIYDWRIAVLQSLAILESLPKDTKVTTFKFESEREIRSPRMAFNHSIFSLINSSIENSQSSDNEGLKKLAAYVKEHDSTWTEYQEGNFKTIQDLNTNPLIKKEEKPVEDPEIFNPMNDLFNEAKDDQDEDDVDDDDLS